MVKGVRNISREVMMSFIKKTLEYISLFIAIITTVSGVLDFFGVQSVSDFFNIFKTSKGVVVGPKTAIVIIFILIVWFAYSCKSLFVRAIAKDWRGGVFGLFAYAFCCAVMSSYVVSFLSIKALYYYSFLLVVNCVLIVSVLYVSFEPLRLHYRKSVAVNVGMESKYIHDKSLLLLLFVELVFIVLSHDF